MSFQSGNGPGFIRALAISLFLHFLLLWPTLPSWSVANPAQPLVATLRAPAVPAPALPVPARVPAHPREARPVAPDLKPPPEGNLQAESLSVSTAESFSRSEVAVRPAGMPAAPSPAMAPAPPGDGLDADGLRGYRLALAREARRFKRYPRQATEAGWGGTTEVRVSVAAGGAGQEVRLVQSSGHAVLDQAALDMLQRAAPLAPVPVTLKGRAFAVDLPVVFEPPAD